METEKDDCNDSNKALTWNNKLNASETPPDFAHKPLSPEGGYELKPADGSYKPIPLDTTTPQEVLPDSNRISSNKVCKAVPPDGVFEPIQRDGGYGWVITFASFMCQFIVDGIAYTFGVMYPHFVDAFGSSKSATSWVSALFVGVPLICGPLAGLCVTKFGCRVTTIVGAIITSLGLFLSSFVNSIQMLTLTYGVVAGFGVAFVYVPSSIIPSFWFEQRRGLATGISNAGSGLGTFVMAPLIEFLLDEYGWRGTLVIISAITLNLVVFGALFRAKPQLDVPEDIPNNNTTEFFTSLPQKCSHHSVQDDKNTIEEKLNGLIEERQSLVDEDTKNQHHKSTNTLYNDTESVHSENVVQVNKLPSNFILMRSGRNLLLLSHQNLAPVSARSSFNHGSASCPQLSAEIGELKEKSSTPKDNSPLTASKPRRLLQFLRSIAKEMFDIRLLTIPVYLIFFISNFMLSCAYDVPYLFLPDYAASLDIERPSFLISIIGIVGIVGFVLFGYLGDLPCVNTPVLYGFSILLCGLLVSTLWLMKTYAALATFSSVFGLLTSANYVLETVVLVQILSLHQLTSAYGLLMFGQGIAGLCGPPIGGTYITYNYFMQ